MTDAKYSLSLHEQIDSDSDGAIGSYAKDFEASGNRRATRESHDAQIAELAERYNVNQRRLMWKMDFCIVPTICLLYVLAYLDRINLGNAAVYGLSDDLQLAGNEYYVSLLIFFVPYVLFEIPSNILLKKLSPHIWLPICTILFGGICIAQGFVKSFSGLMATRFLLGLVETGMLPGCTYLILSWYTRSEAQKRYSFFFGSTCLAGAFGGLIAYGVHHLEGKQGLRGWQWLFIVEGAITCFFGVCFFFILADFPEDARFINDNERQFIKEKLALDQGETYHEQKTDYSQYLKCLKDWRILLSGLCYFGTIVGAYGYAYFAPTIIQTFGYTAVHTQVASIYPWITTFGVSMIFAFVSDYYRVRFPFIVAGAVMGIVGYILLLATSPTAIHVRYASCFLVCLGAYAALPLIICWFTMNLSGHYRKAVGSGFQIGFGNIAGIPAVFIFLKQDSPKFIRGFATSLAMLGWSLAIATLYFILLVRENRKRRQGKRQAEWDALSPEEKQCAGDLNPDFQYTY